MSVSYYVPGCRSQAGVVQTFSTYRDVLQNITKTIRLDANGDKFEIVVNRSGSPDVLYRFDDIEEVVTFVEHLAKARDFSVAWERP